MLIKTADDGVLLSFSNEFAIWMIIYNFDFIEEEQQTNQFLCMGWEL